MTFPLTILGFISLSACADDGGDSGSTPPDLPTPLFDEAIAAGDALFNEATGVNPTLGSLLPQAGSASYQGVVGMTLADDATDPTVLVGDLTLEVDFGTTSPIMGEASDFVDNRDGRYQGSLDITGSQILYDRDGVDEQLVTFGLEGDLMAPDGDTLDVEGNAGGNFHGDGVEYLAGEHSGTVVRDGQVIGYGGGFARERCGAPRTHASHALGE